MPSIDPAVSQVLAARQDATNQEIGIALAAKQLDVAKQTGDAINQLIENVATAQKQIAKGHLDVRV